MIIINYVILKKKTIPFTFKLLYGRIVATLAASVTPPDSPPLLLGGGNEIIDTDNFIADPPTADADAPDGLAAALAAQLTMPLFAEGDAAPSSVDSFDEAAGRSGADR